MCVAGLGVFSCSDTYDLDTEQPSGLTSIYEYLKEQGNYSNVLNLINELGDSITLSQTGSKTMFVADDEAFSTFFASNPWGVKNYAELSLAQKKLLLRSAMIDNPFTTSMLSTATGPTKGEVCRRASSVTIYDSVLAVKSQSELANKLLPPNDKFNEIREKFDSIVLFTDNSTAPPMLMFTPRFLTTNRMASADIDFLYNQPSGTRASEDVYINNSKVIEANIFCKNGFIHKVDRVIMPLDNMAEVIRKKPQASIYSNILERYAAPVYSASNSQSYKTGSGSKIDSVFVKRYFSDRTNGSTYDSSTPFPTEEERNSGLVTKLDGGGSLKYDPGWNGYLPYVYTNREGMQEDMAVMLVPSDAAMTEWWNNGGGTVIKAFYGTLDETPTSVLSELVRVNQLVSFTQSVPSFFADILNDANEPLGITEADVDSVFLACNGVVYLTNKVFAPTSYSSVLFPAVIDTAFTTIGNAISNMQYNAYLNSMVAKYTLLLPTNKGMLTFIDPVSYGRTDGNTGVQLWEVALDSTKEVTSSSAIVVKIYDATISDDGVIEKGAEIRNSPLLGGTGAYNDDGNRSGGHTSVINRFEDMLDNIIITEPYQSGKKYYKTKGNTFVRIDGDREGAKVYGSLQQDYNASIEVAKVHHMSNGTTLVLDGIPMSTRNSVSMLLKQHPETFSEFHQLLSDAGALYKNYEADKSYTAGDQTQGDDNGNLLKIRTAGKPGAEAIPVSDPKNPKKVTSYLLNNYHYTLYAPTNAAMQKAYDMGLPTHAQYEEAKEWDKWYNNATDDDPDKIKAREEGRCDGDSTERIQEVMLDFIKYHIQENAIFLDQGFDTGEYFSGKTALLKSTDVDENNNLYETGKYTPGRPFKIKVESLSSTGMTIRDVIGNERHVETANGLYNMMAREYWYEGAKNNTPYSTKLDNSSFVVVHAIDGPLIYADGKHVGADGETIEPTQFKYLYRELTTDK